MTRALFALTAAILALLVFETTADARSRISGEPSDKRGRFGVGYDTSLGGVGGMSARFQVTRAFGVQGVVSYGRTSFDTLDDDDDVLNNTANNTIRAALRGDVAMSFSRAAAVSLLFGANFYFDTTSFEDELDADNNTDDNQTRFAFEAGIKAEYHFTNFFSVHGTAGIVFLLLNSAQDAGLVGSRRGVPLSTLGGDPIDGSVIAFGLGDAVGTFGVTFWFN